MKDASWHPEALYIAERRWFLSELLLTLRAVGAWKLIAAFQESSKFHSEYFRLEPTYFVHAITLASLAA
jgi:hypothetical protein